MVFVMSPLLPTRSVILSVPSGAGVLIRSSKPGISFTFSSIGLGVGVGVGAGVGFGVGLGVGVGVGLGVGLGVGVGVGFGLALFEASIAAQAALRASLDCLVVNPLFASSR
jgi:hypothetical protein